MFEKLLAHRDHIPPHRIWAFLNEEWKPSLPETVHLLKCNYCRAFSDICLSSQNFGEALGIWLNAKESHDLPEDLG